MAMIRYFPENLILLSLLPFDMGILVLSFSSLFSLSLYRSLSFHLSFYRSLAFSLSLSFSHTFPLFLSHTRLHTLDLVKALVEEFSFDVNEEGPSGSALRMAAAVGRLEIFQYLLSRPECMKEGQLESALCFAAWYTSFLPLILSLFTQQFNFFILFPVLANWHVSAFFLQWILK